MRTAAQSLTVCEHKLIRCSGKVRHLLTLDLRTARLNPKRSEGQLRTDRTGALSMTLYGVCGGEGVTVSAQPGTVTHHSSGLKVAWGSDSNALPLGRVRRDPCAQSGQTVEVPRQRTAAMARRPIRFKVQQTEPYFSCRSTPHALTSKSGAR
jgi:hypothetical protein